MLDRTVGLIVSPIHSMPRDQTIHHELRRRPYDEDTFMPSARTRSESAPKLKESTIGAAKNRINSSLAAPSTGGAATRIFSASP